MIKFDPMVVPVVGSRVTDYQAKNQVQKPSWSHEVRQCPGCDHPLFVMAGAVDEVQAQFPHRELLVMCDECVEPWIQRVARKGGALLSSTNDWTHLDRVLAARAQQAGAN